MNLNLVNIIELRLFTITAVSRFLKILILYANTTIMVKLTLKMYVILGFKSQVIAGAKRMHYPCVAHLVSYFLLESTAQIDHVYALF